MKNKTIKMIILITTILSVIITIMIPNQVKAINPDDYKPGNLQTTDVQPITNIANPIIGAIKTVGVVIAAITLMVLGFKYMAGSVQEKAEYKKTMIPYLIGAVMIVAITQFLGVIIEIVTNVQA